MREIKFRGKRIDNGEWVYGYYFQGFTGISYILVMHDHILRMTEMYEVDPSTVGQYTGLKDKNGKEIFEGDILVHSSQPKVMHVVAWHDNGLMLDYKFTRTYEGESWEEHSYHKIYDSYSVIGNIHDKPELIP